MAKKISIQDWYLKQVLFSIRNSRMEVKKFFFRLLLEGFRQISPDTDRIKK